MQPPSPAPLPDVFPEPTRMMRLAAILGGLASAALIFGGLALSQSVATPEPEADVFEARHVALPIETPPPPPVAAPTEVAVAQLASPIQLEIAASASPVRIQVPDMPVLELDPAPPMARPEIVARFDLARSAVRPLADSGDVDARRVYERGQVDQGPIVVQRVQPRISYKQAVDVDPPRRSIMLLIVNTDGSVGEVRLLRSAKDEEFDKRMIAAIRDWKFTPAVHKGRKVRCWVQQAITVSLKEGSRFESN